jgi:type IX secretion system PorP/SprF family membrane protein
MRIGFKGSYAFHIPFKNNLTLSVGVAARIVRNSINVNTITFRNNNDIAIANATEAVYGGDAELGLFLYHPKFWVGFSAPNLIQTKIDFGANPANRDPLGMGYRHYFLNGGYKFQIPGKDIILEPSVMVKYVQGPYPQVDGGLTVRLLKDQIAFGVFYRNPSFISIQSKFLFDNSIPLLLSFDFSTAPFQNYSIGATEVMLGYDFIKNVDPLPAETPETNENTRF